MSCAACAAATGLADVTAPRLILASASPRRKELLGQLGLQFDCIPAAIDETPHADEPAAEYVRRMATEKAEAVAATHAPPDYAVLGADTTVVDCAAVLGKPSGPDEARAMLGALSGRKHTVISAVCLRADGFAQTRLVQTRVEFATLSSTNIEAYLATPEPWDKAGAYGIQGLGGALVRAIEGSYSNVVGLPLRETWELLGQAGIATALDTVEASPDEV